MQCSSADLSRLRGLLSDPPPLQFEWAWIDLARVIVGGWWESITREGMEARGGKMAFNACNKCPAVARAVMELTQAYADSRQPPVKNAAEIAALVCDLSGAPLDCGQLTAALRALDGDDSATCVSVAVHEG